MGERIAAPDAREQERGARIRIEMARMRGEPRKKEERAPVRIGRHGGEARKRRALRIERRERGASHAAQQGFRQGERVKLGNALAFLFGGAACHRVYLEHPSQK